MKQVEAVIFDMDGTILNTLEDLTISTNYALQKTGRNHDFPADLVKLCYGCGIDGDMEKVLAMEAGCPAEDLEYIGSTIPLSRYGFSDTDVQALKSIFTVYYSAHCHIHTGPYEGIPAVLQALQCQGIRTAVASNKDQGDVKKLADALFPGLFTVTMGNHPAIRRKPAPDMIEQILETMALSKDQALYVGDSEVDIETAQNAGIPCISVDWGFRNRKFLEHHGAPCIVSSAEELLEKILNGDKV